MFEILLVSCLATAPADCRTVRVPTGEDLMEELEDGERDQAERCPE